MNPTIKVTKKQRGDDNLSKGSIFCNASMKNEFAKYRIPIHFNDWTAFVNHDDFASFLEKAIQLKTHLHYSSQGENVKFTKEQIADAVKKVQSILSYTGHNLSCDSLTYRDEYYNSDEIMKQAIINLSDMLSQSSGIHISSHRLVSPDRHVFGSRSWQKDKQEKEAFGAKYSKYQTDVLTDWMIQHKEHPFPDSNQITVLSRNTGLSYSQIVNWATNVRKRNLKATVEGGKKPHQFLDFLFLAVDREKNSLSDKFSFKDDLRSVEMYTKPAIKSTSKKTTGMNKSLQALESSLSLSIPINTTRPGAQFQQCDRLYYTDYTVDRYMNRYSPMGHFDQNCNNYCLSRYHYARDSVPREYVVSSAPSFDFNHPRYSCARTTQESNGDVRAVSPSSEKKIFKTEAYCDIESALLIVPSKNVIHKNLPHGDEEINDNIWTRTCCDHRRGSQSENSNWSDTEVLQQFTRDGILNSPRTSDDDLSSTGLRSISFEDDCESFSSGVGVSRDVFRKGDRIDTIFKDNHTGRSSLTEHDITYLLSDTNDDGNLVSDEVFDELFFDEMMHVEV